MRSLTAPLVKLAVFAVVTIMASYVLITTITNAGYGATKAYSAAFTDVAGLVQGDEVRIAGVRVGQVTGIGLSPQRQKPVAVVSMQVDSTVALPRNVQATIRYRNLVGQRYVALTEAPGSAGALLPAGAQIPLTQTHPALDLTTLFGGFKPLFQALTPADVNRLSYEVIQVFQGEGGTMEQLLSHVASLSNSLADKDKVIGSVIDNLTTVLGNVAARDQELSHLVVSLQQFVSGLAQDKDAIFNSLQTINTLADSTSNLLQQARPPLAADISQLGALSTNLSNSKDVLNRFLQLEPTKLDLVTRTAVNGSWFNFFLCGAGGYLVLPGTGSNPSDGINVPAGGLNNGEKGCGS
jgi:phospholipid/cholesterol/gamma-HCH transport system substrate-binding protein